MPNPEGSPETRIKHQKRKQIKEGGRFVNIPDHNQYDEREDPHGQKPVNAEALLDQVVHLIEQEVPHKRTKRG